MASWFDQSQVIVEGSGIMAESLSISSQSSVEGVRALGNKGVVQYSAKGPQQTNVSVSYYVEPGNEPNYGTVQSLKNDFNSFNYKPLRLELGGITGSGWINRYSVRSTVNTPTKASVSYVVFDQMSGVGSTAVTGVFDQSRLLRTAHGWSTFLIPPIETESMFSDFEYNCSLDWKPIFGLGKKTPIQMQLLGITESMSITRNIFKPITFSGQPSSEYYDQITGIAFSGLEASWGVATSGITFNISGAPVVDSDFSLNTNGYLTVKSSITKHY